MSGETNLSILNELLNFVLHGRQERAEKPQPVALSEDRELMIAARITEGGGGESLLPTDGAVMTGVLTDYFTAVSPSKVYVEVANSGNVEGATCRVVYRVNGAAVERDVLPSVTPVPLGVGIRVGPYLLAAGGTIAGSCSPPGTVTISPIPFRVGS